MQMHFFIALRRFLVLPGMLLCALPLSAAPVSLQEAGRDVLTYAPALKSVEASRNSAAEDKQISRAYLLPYVEASGSLLKIRQDYNYDQALAIPLATRVNNNQRQFGIKAYQPLFDLEKWSRFKLGETSAAMGETALHQAEHQTMLMASMAWLDVMRAHARVEACKASEMAMTSLAAQAKASFEAGISSVNGSLAAVSRRDLATAERINAEQRLMQAQAILSSLLGRDVDVKVIPGQEIVPIPLPASSEQAWLERTDHADRVAMAEHGVELAAAGKQQALGRALPKLQLVAGWQKQLNTEGSFGTGYRLDNRYIGVEMSVPLFAGGGTVAQQRKSTQEAVRADADLAEAKRSARLAIRQAWLQWQSSGAHLNAMKAALVSAAHERKAAKAGFEAGLRNMTELLDAEERFSETRAGFVDTIAEHAASVLQLYQEAGELDMNQLAKVEQWLAASKP